MRNDLQNIARFLVDAFDMDMQLYTGNLMKQLRATEQGERFAAWAETNPIAFKTLLRAISASAQRIPKDDNLLMQAVSDQLGRLPVEIYRAILDGHNIDSSIEVSHKNTQSDEDFRKSYENALEGLSDEDLRQIVNLPQAKVREWVNSPAKIRPYLLLKWQKEELRSSEHIENIKNHMGTIVKNIDGEALDIKKNLEDFIDKRRKTIKSRPFLKFW